MRILKSVLSLFLLKNIVTKAYDSHFQVLLYYRNILTFLFNVLYFCDEDYERSHVL